MAIDDKYINYNLSLVDPNDIIIEKPIEYKAEIDINIPEPVNLKEENQTEVIEVLPEEKVNVDISTYALLEEKLSEEEEETTIDLDKGGADVLVAREYPIVGIDSEFTSHKMFETKVGLDGALYAPDQSTVMQDVEITDSNKGKIEPSEEKLKEEEVRELFNQDFEVRVLDQEYEPEKSSVEEPSKYYTFRLKEKPLKDKTVNLIDFSPYVRGKVAKDPYSTNELTYEDVVRKLNKKGQTSNLGSLHVYPVNPGGEGGISSKYMIPFEFNPKITESGRSAKYETTSLLSRVGDIYSYIKTDSSSVQLTTKYQVLTSGEDDIKVGDHSRVGSWMDMFTLRNIQSIEMAFRGLVYPQTSKEEGSFFRPPLIKIVFGNANKAADGKTVDKTVPFNNLLTYPYKMARETKVYHKSFIVVKVDIKKDWDNYPLILNNDEDGILDLQGFDVTIDLAEVDPMYIGVLPSFEDFYSIVPALTRI